jgi:hypothetical protein
MMVAYSFNPRFGQPIVDRTKGGTIRSNRKRHARPGEALQLYQGMRTKRCRLISREVCLDVQPAELNFRLQCVTVARATWIHAHALDAFARFDGFVDWAALRQFWRETHDTTTAFTGHHIRWLPWPTALEEAIAA